MAMIKLLIDVAFGGECERRDPDRAAVELKRAGFKVVRVPEEFRPRLEDPLDDHSEVMISVSEADYAAFINAPCDETGSSRCDPRRMVDALWLEVDRIVFPYGGSSSECGALPPGHVPFSRLWSDEDELPLWGNTLH